MLPCFLAGRSFRIGPVQPELLRARRHPGSALSTDADDLENVLRFANAPEHRGIEDIDANPSGASNRSLQAPIGRGNDVAPGKITAFCNRPKQAAPVNALQHESFSFR